MMDFRAPGWLDKPDGGALASYPSGQRDLTVNQTALHSGVRIPHSPPLENTDNKAPPTFGSEGLFRVWWLFSGCLLWCAQSVEVLDVALAQIHHYLLATFAGTESCGTVAMHLNGRV